MTTQLDRPYDKVDISSFDFWALPAAERERSFAELRRHRPISWHPPVPSVTGDNGDDPGFWAVVRHRDVVEVSRRHDVFLSGRGVMFAEAPIEVLEATQSFLAMDAPRHTSLRKLVRAAFTPRQIRTIESQIQTNARQIVQELASTGSGADFVQLCASQLPMRTLSDMMGIPEQDRVHVTLEVENLVCAADPVFLDGRNTLEVMFGAAMSLHQTALSLAQQRRANPRDDLITSLVEAQVDGQRLTDAEIAAFFVLLSVAGNDTTRQTTSHALKALTDFPDQKAWLLEDFDNRIGSAIEEFIRWATPVMTFRRTAAVDTELAGQQILSGEKVVMFYSSANHDDLAFDRPEQFDLARNPNPHVGFGGGGAHYCLGHLVAKTQLRAIFAELLRQLPDIAAGKTHYVTSYFTHMVRSMDCTFSS